MTRKPPTPEEYELYKQRFNNWGRWGADDELGTLNHISPQVRRSAVATIREGRVVSLARPLATAAALQGHRNPQPADHRLTIGESGCSDYVGVAYHGFANTHVDALCHIFTQDGMMFGGRPKSEVSESGALTNSIDRVKNGIVTRGILYDVPLHRGVEHVTSSDPVHGDELLEISVARGFTPRPGDAVLVRMGAEAFWSADPDFQPAWNAPGLHASAMEFLFDHDASLLGWDLMEAPGQEA